MTGRGCGYRGFEKRDSVMSAGAQILQDLENLKARLHKMEHELSFFQDIRPIACLLNPDATCDPAILEKASILVDTIAVEFCQRIECRHQVLVFNAPDGTPLEHTKNAILTACIMPNTTCTARRLQKSKLSVHCPIMMQFRDENDVVRLLTSQDLLPSTEELRTIEGKAARTRIQSSVGLSPGPNTTDAVRLQARAMTIPIINSTRSRRRPSDLLFFRVPPPPTYALGLEHLLSRPRYVTHPRESVPCSSQDKWTLLRPPDNYISSMSNHTYLPNCIVGDVSKFLISTVCSPTDLSMMRFNARSLLPKVHNPRAIIVVARPSRIGMTKTWLSVENPDKAVSIPALLRNLKDSAVPRGDGIPSRDLTHGGQDGKTLVLSLLNHSTNSEIVPSQWKRTDVRLFSNRI
ncbi:hypothetical protein CLF_107658 [Clonorchis sinensis]|uniref:Uncharacterized protein n=1 Tax=Clonorchis sinensis TaxID=79923 RepID=G7YH03_CLOSI|nr:hypothetical protein CLF_107658 [Clonorchis sinensis]